MKPGYSQRRFSLNPPVLKKEVSSKKAHASGPSFFWKQENISGNKDRNASACKEHKKGNHLFRCECFRKSCGTGTENRFVLAGRLPAETDMDLHLLTYRKNTSGGREGVTVCLSTCRRPGINDRQGKILSSPCCPGWSGRRHHVSCENLT